MNEYKTILHLCADIGSDSQPYREAGYNVICVGKDTDVRRYTPPENVYGIIANPPCTMFSIARSKAKTPRNLREGMECVENCLRIIWECQYRIVGDQRTSPLKFWALENPASGFLKWFLGNPTFQYCQSEYGAMITKKTALWGMFNPPKRPLLFAQLPVGYTLGSRHETSRNETSRHDTRSICPINFAKSFFEANP